jgi:hypothetical protein
VDRGLAAATKSFIIRQRTTRRVGKFVVLLKSDFVSAHDEWSFDNHLVNRLLIFAADTLNVAHAKSACGNGNHLGTVAAILEPVTKYISGL